MSKNIPAEIKKILLEGTPDQRKYLCEKRFIYFAIYYFAEYFNYKIPPFHYDMYQDLRDVADGKLSQLVWVMFRESAKTSIARMFAVWCICYKKRHYINFDSYDKDNAESSTFDIAVALQTNKRLIADFGQLFNERRTDDEKKRKKISSFITTNDIKVEAFSTQESVRGRLYKQFRPDLLILDDFETDKTRYSPPVTEAIRRHIDEFKSGLATDSWVIYLCNLITESGNVYRIMQEAQNNPRSRVRKIEVVMDEQIVWPDKYVFTDDEADTVNKAIADKMKWKISLEAKKRDLGEKVYAENMLNSPEEGGDLVFDRQRMDEFLLIVKPPKKRIGEWYVWEEYNAKHRYALGADTSAGVGRDSNAGVLIDFSMLPARQIASYANNRIAPDVFAHELRRMGLKYGECLIIPELNNTGHATITELKRIYDLGKIFRSRKNIKILAKPDQKLGFETTGGNKSEIIYQLKSAVEDGVLKITDKRILEEMRRYGQSDLMDGKRQEMTRHFDLLMACALAWVGRDFAEVKHRDVYNQPAYEGGSEYEYTEQRKSDDLLMKDPLEAPHLGRRTTSESGWDYEQPDYEN